MVQLAPAATVPPLTQGVTVRVFLTVASAKSPLVAMVVMFSVAFPVLVRTTFFAALFVPTRILVHLSEVGARLTTGPPPPPVPASALIRPAPFGLPQPVTRS